MDKRNLIMILDLRGQSDSELLALTDMFVNEEINWTWLDEIKRQYECKHKKDCNCCDGIAEIKKITKKILSEGM